MKVHGKTGVALAAMAALLSGSFASAARAADEPVPADGRTAPWEGSVVADGVTSVVVPERAVGLRVVAVGGRGGGGRGGRGAVVSATVPVRRGQAVKLAPGGDGEFIFTNSILRYSAPGEGGRASVVSLCGAGASASCDALDARVLVAGAGGGSAGGGTAWGSFPSRYVVARGGDAGAPGFDYSNARGTAGYRGMPGGAAAPGAGGRGGAVPNDCTTGLPGVPGGDGGPGDGPRGGAGGTGFDFTLTGGDGGEGYFGGGGGGGGASCGARDSGQADLDEGDAAGGGGGSSLVPAGGSVAVNSGVERWYLPHIRYSFVLDTTAPRIDATAPRNGERVPQGAAIRARFSCSDERAGGLASCAGSVADGSALDTRRPGRRQLTVTATDDAGNVTRETIRYTVAAARASRVAANARRVRFALSGSAPVTVRIERLGTGSWWQLGARRKTVRAGTTTVRLDGALARKLRLPGRYRAVVKPADAPAVIRYFTIR